MLSIMSINHKFMELTPKELIKIICEYNIDGIEICCDGINDLEYFNNIAYECKLHNKRFQIHGDSGLEINKQLEFLKKVENISDMLGYKINIVLHSLYDDNKEISIKKTKEYMDKITNNINNDKLIINLENLNDSDGFDRLNKENILPIICNNDNLYFTYDVGHELSDLESVMTTKDYIIPVIKNVHIHTNKNNHYSKTFDHQPIYKNDEYWTNLLKYITFLKINNYCGTIVYEYDLYALDGETIKEKVINYAKSIDLFQQSYK